MKKQLFSSLFVSKTKMKKQITTRFFNFRFCVQMNNGKNR